jgi:hypothetical protein
MQNWENRILILLPGKKVTLRRDVSVSIRLSTLACQRLKVDYPYRTGLSKRPARSDAVPFDRVWITSRGGY